MLVIARTLSGLIEAAGRMGNSINIFSIELTFMYFTSIYLVVSIRQEQTEKGIILQMEAVQNLISGIAGLVGYWKLYFPRVPETRFSWKTSRAFCKSQISTVKFDWPEIPFAWEIYIHHTVRKRTLFISLQNMNHMFQTSSAQIIRHEYDEQEFSQLNEIIS